MGPAIQCHLGAPTGIREADLRLRDGDTIPRVSLENVCSKSLSVENINGEIGLKHFDWVLDSFRNTNIYRPFTS